MNISQILHNVGMSSRSAYYSGRGATLSDLNSEILINIQSEIKKHHGKDAATSFLNMVQSMEEMNATDFIENCFRLERNAYQWSDEKSQKNGFNFDKYEEGNDNGAQVKASIFSALGRGNRNDTEQIRGRFLQVNGIRPKMIYFCY